MAEVIVLLMHEELGEVKLEIYIYVRDLHGLHHSLQLLVCRLQCRHLKQWISLHSVPKRKRSMTKNLIQMGTHIIRFAGHL